MTAPETGPTLSENKQLMDIEDRVQSQASLDSWAIIILAPDNPARMASAIALAWMAHHMGSDFVCSTFMRH